MIQYGQEGTCKTAGCHFRLQPLVHYDKDRVEVGFLDGAGGKSIKEFHL